MTGGFGPIWSHNLIVTDEFVHRLFTFSDAESVLIGSPPSPEGEATP